MSDADFRLRFVVQRAAWAEVMVDGVSRGRMERGLVVLFGVAAPAERAGFDPVRDSAVAGAIERAVHKLLGLRIFCDDEGKMNLSVRDVEGGVYLVSQFTLFADCRKGFRPGFSAAARPPFAEPVYDFLVKTVKEQAGGLPVYSGVFGGDMKVSLLNDGPVTIVLDADERGMLG